MEAIIGAMSGTRTSWTYKGLCLVVEEWGGAFSFVVMTKDDERTIAGGIERSFEAASQTAQKAADALLAMPIALAG